MALDVLGFGLFRVSGHSMMPHLRAGDFVLTRPWWPWWPWQRPAMDDLVVFTAGSGQRMIKKVTGILPDGRVTVAGESALSVTQADLGPVGRKAISGKVWMTITPSDAEQNLPVE